MVLTDHHCTTMRSSFLMVCIAGLLLVNDCHGVDRDIFRTCEQTSFCTRCRGVQPGVSTYQLLLNTLQVEATNIQAQIVNTDNDVTFRFQLFALVDGTFRMKINEWAPLKPRYEVEYSLVGEPSQDNLVVVETTGESVTVQSGVNRVQVFASPFRVDLFSGDQLVISTNARGLMRFEHLQAKKERQNGAQKGTRKIFNRHRDSMPNGPTAVAIDFTFVGAQHAYGIPEHSDSFSLKSTQSTDPYRLYNLDVFEYEIANPMALYGSVPVLMAHGVASTVGVFWLNAAETWIDIDKSDVQNIAAHFMSESGIVDTFFMLGPQPKDVFRQYSKLTGTAPLPPLFSLAYHQSRWNYESQEDVKGVAAGFDEHDLPLDVMWLDIEYTDAKKYFTWDPVNFPQPTEMMNNLTAQGRKMVIIIDPHIKRDPDYFLNVDAINNNYYVKTVDGVDFEGQCWPGLSSYLDVYNPVVRDYYQSLYQLENFEGTTLDTHFWNDMNEPSVFDGPEITVPKDVVHYGGWENRDVHNTYGMVYTMSTHNAQLQRSNNSLRPFLLTRAHFAGSQRFTAVWTGDNKADWTHMAATIPMCLSLSVAGISFCGADVGGFFGNPDGEMISRWYQLGAYQPFYRSHSEMTTNRREPWLFDDDTLNIIRVALRERYALLPLWYTLFFEHERTGTPVMRPLWAEFPTETAVFAIDDEYLIGDSLLVHPVTQQGASDVTIYLPGGLNQRWFEVHSFISYTGGVFTLPVTSQTIPVFQRGGKIVSKKAVQRSASTLMNDDPYTVIVALDTNGSASGTLYIDDNKSFDYRQGQYLYLSLNYENNTLTSTNIDNTDFPTESLLEEIIVLSVPEFTTAYLESSKLGKVQLDVKYNKDSQSLVISKPGVNMAEEWVIKLQ